MSKIIISREAQSVNKLRDYEIYIDNIRAGLIGDGEEKTIKAEQGMHEIYAKIDFHKSQNLIIDLTEDEELRLICGTKITGVKQVVAPIYSLFSKDCIYLEHVDNTKNIQNYSSKAINGGGKNEFILKYGIIRWGIPAGIIYSIFSQIFGHRSTSIKSFFTITAINLLVISLFGGCLFGITMWNMKNKNNS